MMSIRKRGVHKWGVWRKNLGDRIPRLISHHKTQAAAERRLKRFLPFRLGERVWVGRAY
jgi:hypothetical protein